MMIISADHKNQKKNKCLGVYFLKSEKLLGAQTLLIEPSINENPKQKEEQTTTKIKKHIQI